jgi:hypothetical protein
VEVRPLPFPLSALPLEADDFAAPDLQNAVKIKRGKETIIFRTDKGDDKKMLLLAFKKVAEELMNKKRKEMLNEAEARKGDVSCFPLLSSLPYYLDVLC